MSFHECVAFVFEMMRPLTHPPFPRHDPNRRFYPDADQEGAE